MDKFEFIFECCSMIFGLTVFIFGTWFTIIFLLAAMNSSVTIN